jgi:hypothetical protein
MKINKCRHKDCEEPRLKKPGNTSMYFKYCPHHQIVDVLSKMNAQKQKDKEGLEAMLKTGSGKATSEESKALKLADSWFSKWVRLKHSFELNGIQQAKCFTCDRIYPIVMMDCGHWQKRQYMATRHQPDNARPQCTSCNDWNKGRYEVFEERLSIEISKAEVENLKQLAKTTFHYTTEYLREVSNTYKRKFNELLKQRGIKNPWR